MPPRIQRFRLRLMCFNLEVTHVSGKQQLTADALSRAPASVPSDEDISLVNDAAVMARQTLDALPATSRKLQEIVTQQKADPETIEVRDCCQRGWPAFMPQNPLLHQYWTNQRYLTIVDDVLLFNDCIVIPTNMRLEMLNRLHESHLGVTKLPNFGSDIRLVAKYLFSDRGYGQKMLCLRQAKTNYQGASPSFFLSKTSLVTSSHGSLRPPREDLPAAGRLPFSLAGNSTS